MAKTGSTPAPAGRKGEPPGGNGLTWEAFEPLLAAALGRLDPGSYLVLSTPEEDPGYYVQFRQDGPDGFRAEAIGNMNLLRPWALTPTRLERMAALGWQAPLPPDRPDANFTRHWPAPAPFAEIASLAVRSLRDVYRVGGPSGLVYRKGNQQSGNLDEPGLGIGPEDPGGLDTSGKAAGTQERVRSWPVTHDRYGDRYLRAVLRPDGELLLEGQDLGQDLPFAGVKGVREYEYVHTIPAEEVPALIAALGGEPGDDVLDQLVSRFPQGPAAHFSEFFAEHGIRAGFWNHFNAD